MDKETTLQDLVRFVRSQERLKKARQGKKMADIKIHARSGQEQFNGFEDCDFRGEKRPTGKDHDEKQKTIFEKANAPDDLVAKVLEHGPALNRLLAEIDFLPSKIAGVDVGEILGRVGAGETLRIGVFDD